MTKQFILGFTASTLALTAAAGADLPLKAKAVEYVRICDTFGLGFYYIPGTDTCIKVGGYMRVDFYGNSGGGHSPYLSGAGGRDNRETSDYQTRSRAVMSYDVRTQTEYGTLRAFMRGGFELNASDANYRGRQWFERAFIQFAGLTVGKAQSFFGFYNDALNYTTLEGGGQTDTGLNLIAYTAEFAGGFSATISAEDTNHHRANIFDANTAAMPPGAGPGLGIGAITGGTLYGDYRAARYPDIVGKLRVDQAWGAAQLSAAVHDASGLYYGPTSLGQGGLPSLNATGWAVQGGLKFNLPWAKGDELWLQAAWARGAVNYLGWNPFVQTSQFAMYGGTPTAGCGGGAACGNLGLAWTHDAVYNSLNGISLTQGWAVLAAVQHYWTPALRTSVFGQYTSLDYGATATATFCAAPPAASAGASTATLTVCNPDFRILQIGTRTVWSPVRNLDIGFEVLYSRLDQNHVGAWTQVGANGARPPGLYVASDQDTWSGMVRFQRNFWP